MSFQFNGKSFPLINSVSLIDLLKQYHIEMATPGVAVAINDQIILRNHWSQIQVEKGDRVEIIHAVQGG